MEPTAPPPPPSPPPPSSSSTEPYNLTLDDIESALLATQDRFILEKAAGTALNVCSYDQGAISQPIYSCLTCTTTTDDGSTQYVAVCGACAFNCHQDHELEECYEKRDMRCDCPTLRTRPLPPSSSPLPTCSLNPPTSSYPPHSNPYNHNFLGRYCRCDSEHDPTTDVMYQCHLCEDWFHDRCLTVEQKEPPGDEELFVCGGCVGEERWRWLVPYLIEGQAHVERKEEEEKKEQDGGEGTIDLFPEVTKRKEQQTMNGGGERKEVEDTPPGWTCAHCSYFNQPSNDECFGCEQAKRVKPAPASDSNGSTPSQCTRLTTIPSSFLLSSPHDIWLSPSWVSLLCDCTECLSLYTLHVPFLLPYLSSSSPPPSPLPTQSDMVDSYLSSLPRDAVLNGMSAIQDWNDVVMAGLKRLTGEVGDGVVTKEMVDEVVREAREECGRRRRKRMEEEEEVGSEGEGNKRARFEE